MTAIATESGTQVPVFKRILRLDEGAGLLCHDAGEGVAGLVQVYMINPGLGGIAFEVMHEGVRDERLTNTTVVDGQE